MLKSVLIICVSLLMSSSAHVLLRKGMIGVAPALEQTDSFLELAWTTLINPFVFAGMLLHVAALGVWLWALSRVEISFAYPFLALGYILVIGMAYFWLGEQIGPTKIAGTVLVVLGLVVLSRG